MVSLLEAILLGIIQGVTEWLPISSSGHLVIAQEALKLRVPLFFDILLHVATLMVIFVFFWRDIGQILRSILRLDFQGEDGRIVIYIIIGNIPIALVGYFLYEVIESFFSNLVVVGISLIFTGVLLYLSRFTESERDLTYLSSLIIGVSQAAALVPGVSRSGSTIATGLLTKIKREGAFRFSFLLAIPAIIGALFFETQNIANYEIDLVPMIIGFSVAMITGYLSLKLLSKLVLAGSFHHFSYYCWILGILLLVAVVI